jgi:hypothetical protein
MKAYSVVCTRTNSGLYKYDVVEGESFLVCPSTSFEWRLSNYEKKVAEKLAELFEKYPIEVQSEISKKIKAGIIQLGVKGTK